MALSWLGGYKVAAFRRFKTFNVINNFLLFSNFSSFLFFYFLFHYEMISKKEEKNKRKIFLCDDGIKSIF